MGYSFVTEPAEVDFERWDALHPEEAENSTEEDDDGKFI